MSQLFLNNFASTFVADVLAIQTTGTPATELGYGILQLSDGASGSLINPGAGNYYILTAYKRIGSLEFNYEVIKVTSVDNSTPGECRITVLRAQEGTNAKAYVAGDNVSLRWTKGGAENSVQRDATETLTNKTLTNPSYSGTTANGGTVTTIDINGGTIDGTVIGGTTKAVGGFTDLTVSGNTTLGDSAADTVTVNASRITGNFSSTTIANRVMFQTSTANAPTIVTAIPNGSGSNAGYVACASFSDPANISWASLDIPLSVGMRLMAEKTGLGSYLPMIFYTGGAERMRIATDGAVTIPGALSVGSLNGGPLAGFRNRIINGDMRVAQRGTTVAATSGGYTLDGWRAPGAGGTTTSQIQDSPSGYGYCLQATHTSGFDWYDHRIESLNMLSLVGQPVVLTAWVKLVSGVATGSIAFATPTVVNNFGSLNSNVGSTGFTATTSWQKITVTGTIPASGVNGLNIGINLDSGSSVVRFTDVQLEPGTVATPFEFRPYSVELALCQRYYFRITPTVGSGLFGLAAALSTTFAGVIIPFPVPLLAVPSALEQSGTAGDYAVSFAGTNTVCTLIPSIAAATTIYAAQVNFNTGATLTPGQAGKGILNGTTSGFLGFRAEL